MPAPPAPRPFAVQDLRRAMRSILSALVLVTSFASSQAAALDRTPVPSSHLASVGYDATARVLEIEFQSGGIYRYRDVPKEIFDRLLAAESKGRFFFSHIREHFRFERVTTRSAAGK